MPETILVTGGAGFIGSHLVDALLQEGNTVRVFDNLEPQVHGSLRESGRWPTYCNSDAQYILGDVRDRDALHRALQGVDVVYHQAAMVGVGQSMYQIERYVDVNTRGTAILLDLIANDNAIRDRLRKLIVASSMSIYGEGAYSCTVHGTVYPTLRASAQLAEHDWELRCPAPVSNGHSSSCQTCNLPLAPQPTPEAKPLHSTSIYAISKKDQEEMGLAFGQAYTIPVVALRYFNTYGPRQALSNPYTGVAAIFSGRLLNGNAPVLFEDGKQTRDFVHVSDIVQANLLARRCDDMKNGVFNVGTGQSTSVLDVAQELARHLESGLEPEITCQFRAGDIRHCVADIGQIKSYGYRPRLTFKEGIAELVTWVRSQNATDSFEAARRELAVRGLAA